ncbi:hypothetical protein DBR00_11580 [Pseudomonas sp. HMWF032]|nr:hypothetical protein DBR00_11580 [Pseudomonas sp. HMWF032]PTT85368.1 hypothetical protein DBR41_04165 [Pseudomonas sp. HMWF010]
MEKILGSLRTPINRLGFAIFVVGLAMILTGLLGSIDWLDHYGRWEPNLPSQRALFDIHYPYQAGWWRPTFRWGCAFAIVGAWFAWLFQPTLGRLYLWIKG